MASFSTLQDFVNDYNRNFAGQVSRRWKWYYGRIGDQLKPLATYLKAEHNNGKGIPSKITLNDALAEVAEHFPNDNYFVRYPEVKKVRDDIAAEAAAKKAAEEAAAAAAAAAAKKAAEEAAAAAAAKKAAEEAAAKKAAEEAAAAAAKKAAEEAAAKKAAEEAAAAAAAAAAKKAKEEAEAFARLQAEEAARKAAEEAAAAKKAAEEAAAKKAAEEAAAAAAAAAAKKAAEEAAAKKAAEEAAAAAAKKAAEEAAAKKAAEDAIKAAEAAAAKKKAEEEAAAAAAAELAARKAGKTQFNKFEDFVDYYNRNHVDSVSKYWDWFSGQVGTKLYTFSEKLRSEHNNGKGIASKVSYEQAWDVFNDHFFDDDYYDRYSDVVNHKDTIKAEAEAEEARRKAAEEAAAEAAKKAAEEAAAKKAAEEAAAAAAAAEAAAKKKAEEEAAAAAAAAKKAAEEAAAAKKAAEEAAAAAAADKAKREAEEAAEAAAAAAAEEAARKEGKTQFNTFQDFVNYYNRNHVDSVSRYWDWFSGQVGTKLYALSEKIRAKHNNGKGIATNITYEQALDVLDDNFPDDDYYTRYSDVVQHKEDKLAAEIAAAEAAAAAAKKAADEAAIKAAEEAAAAAKAEQERLEAAALQEARDKQKREWKGTQTYNTLQDFVNDYNRNYAGNVSKYWDWFYGRTGEKFKELAEKLRARHNTGVFSDKLAKEITLDQVTDLIREEYSDDWYFNEFPAVAEREAEITLEEAKKQAEAEAAAEAEQQALIANETPEERYARLSGLGVGGPQSEAYKKKLQEMFDRVSPIKDNEQALLDLEESLKDDLPSLALLESVYRSVFFVTEDIIPEEAKRVSYRINEVENPVSTPTDYDAPPVPDSDNDGYSDDIDAFPNDPSEFSDKDKDGVGDNADAFPYSPEESVDTDGDRIGDNADVYPEDSRYYSTPQRESLEEQAMVDTFVLENSRAIYGAYSMHEMGKLIDNVSGEDDSWKKVYYTDEVSQFNTWREHFINKNGRLPNRAEANTWLKNRMWMADTGTYGRPGFTPNVPNANGRKVIDYLDLEDSFMSQGRLSEREAKQEGLKNWITSGRPVNTPLWVNLSGAGVEVTPGADQLIKAIAKADGYIDGSLTDAEQALISRYRVSINNAFGAMEDGTTPWDREQLINLGSAMSLGDLWDELANIDRKTDQRYHYFMRDRKAAEVQALRNQHATDPNLNTNQRRALYEKAGRLEAMSLEDYKNNYSAVGLEEFQYKEWLDSIKDYNVASYIELPESFDMDLGVNYDKDRLYMKLPGDDDVILGKYNHTAHISTVDGKVAQNLNNPSVRNMFTDAADYPHGHGTEAGYFVDISGGEGKIGEYTMMWVELQEEPSSLEKFIDDIGPLKVLVQLGLTLTGRPDLALQVEAANIALKVVDGQTLHAEDWASLALFGLQKFGKITMPVSEAEAAKQAAAQGLVEGTKAYNDFMAVKMAGIGLAGLNGKQTISLIRAAGSGDVKSAILPVLGEFGDGWIKSGLGHLGVPDNVINAITPAQYEAINEVVSDMAKGATFEEAMAGQALDWLGDSIGDNAKLKQFFDGLEGDLKYMLRVAEEFILNDDIKALGQYILDTVEELPFKDILSNIEDDFEGTLRRLDEALNVSGIVENFDEELLQPLEDSINGLMAPLAAKATLMYEELPEGFRNQLDKLTNDIDKYLDNSFSNLDGPIKEGVRQGLVQAVLGNDGTIEGKAAVVRAFTNELIITQEIAKLDNSIVDVVTAPVLAAGMRSAINGMLMNNPNIGDGVLSAMAGVAISSIADSLIAGTFAQDFKTYMDNVSGDYDLAVNKRDELDELQGRGEVLEGEMETALAERDALLKQRDDLKTLAESPYASETDQRNYAALLQDPDFERQLVEANQEVVRVSNEIKQLKYEEGVLVEEYTEIRDTLTATTKFNPAVQAYEGDVFKDMVLRIAPNFNETEYKLANGLSADDDAFEHYISAGLHENAPINATEYNERTTAALSNITTRALTASGVDVSTLKPEELKALTRHFADFASEAMPDGMTPLEYLEQQSNLTDDQVKANGDAAIAEVFGSRAALDETLVNRAAQDFYRTLYGDDLTDAEIRQRMNDVATGTIRYTIDDDGNIMWGGDGFKRTEFNPDSGEFETYQYDAGGGLKYLLNDDGSEPLVKEYIQTPIFTDKNSLQETSPLAYVTFLRDAVDNSPESAWLAERTREMNQLIDMSVSEDDKIKIFEDYNDDVAAFRAEQDLREGFDGVPYSELPWIVRIAKDSLDYYQDAIDETQTKIDELNAIDGPLSAKQEQNLDMLEDQLEDLQGGLESFANVTIRFPAGVANIFNEGVRALGKFGETIPAQVEAERKRREIILNGGTIDEANAAADEILNAAYKDIDFGSVVNNDFSRTTNMLESLAFGYLPEVYQEDVQEFWQTVEDAEGVGGKLEALYGEITDKPKVFLVEVIGMEIGQELATMVTSLGLGKVATKAAGLAVADDVARAVGVSTAVTTNRGLEVTEAYSGAFTEAYDTSYEELIEIGYEPADAMAKAGEIAVGAGAISVLLMSTMPGAQALDKTVLSTAGKKALTELGERFVDGVGVITKETLNEIVQEGGVSVYLESALYNAGVEDRDYAGNIALNTTVAGLAAFGTTGTIYGLGMPTANIGGSDSSNPVTNIVLSSAPVVDAMNSGDPTQVQSVLGELGITPDVSNDLYIDVMNVADDNAYVTESEAKESFARLGIDSPSEADVDHAMALDSEAGLDDELTYYWQQTQGPIPLDDDSDGVYNSVDAFPNDPNESVDTDNDGVGDNADVFPENPDETLDTDSDGVGDNADAFPEDATETVDTDGDGLGDNADEDDDNDFITDNFDAFPLRADEQQDVDEDGLGDNEDPDDDNDGTLDDVDAFPNNPEETTDSDNDGVGDNADAFPENADETVDSDNDGVGDNTDAFPNDDSETTDSDNDGVGDNLDEYPEDAYYATTEDFEEANDMERLGKYALVADINGDGVVDALTDGLLFLRHAFDIHTTNPDALVDGLEVEGAVRNTAKEVIEYLEDPRVQQLFDFDKDGEVDALTDGLQFLRTLFEISPENIVDGTLRGGAESVETLDNIASAMYSAFSLDEDGLPTDELKFIDVGAGALQNRPFEIDDVNDVNNEEFLDSLDAVSYDDLNNLEFSDTDNDGIGDNADAFPEDASETLDTDNDGVGDNADVFPNDATETVDTDEDGVGDNADVFPNDASETLDTDEDGVGDNADVFPEDAAEYLDTDNDGVGDNADVFPEDASETLDTDNDGVGDNADAFPEDASETLDTDSDGVGDNVDVFPEDASETVDTDNDGVGDNADVFPEDASETLDTDSDGVGDNTDAFPEDASETLDTDEDGVGDNADAFPEDASETLDTDSDGVGDNADVFPEDAAEYLDTDEDGVGDNADVFPEDASETLDTDNDGVGDNADAFPEDASETLDTDSDGVGDNVDVFPEDASEYLDTDEDGVGDNADAFPEDASETLDTDSDGVGDNTDAFPEDASETLDTDEDGVGDNADAFPEDPDETLDTDSDGIGDEADAFPEDATETVDTDNDGVGDNADRDDDNDGFDDMFDWFPTDPRYALDTDKDGVPNEIDPDADGDGVLNEEDGAPLDPEETLDTDGDGIGNNRDWDDDGDGVPDNLDAFPLDESERRDTDGDGIGDNADYYPRDAERQELIDTDGDLVDDRDDAFPEDASETLDTDNDGVGDNADAFPEDATETVDTDNDGVGDNADVFPEDPDETLDTDEDGVGDNADAFPEDATETVDTDADGVGDNADVFPEDASETLDTDEDGVGDNADAFPEDASEYLDTDEDGVGDNADVFPEDATETLDTDNDGVGDNADVFPEDASEYLDTDSDGVGDNADVFPNDATETVDTDEDGVGDNADVFPEDASEYLDTDEDGVGDNADVFPEDATETLDTDNDGVGDNADVFPEDASEYLDTDEDGVGDNADVFPEDASEYLDTDNDGVGDNADVFPEDATETVDTDNDGVGDNADVFPEDASEYLDTDEDGVGDNADVFPEDASEYLDTDNDGVGDNADVFPEDASETLDTDSDGVGDNADVFPEDASEYLDTDNDGVGDNADVFPEDATETLDTDEDGVGDNADAFPEDASETLDTDEDGVGDNADVFPEDPDETLDTDNDGIGDNADVFPEDASEYLDTDNDGVGDNTDAFPEDATESVDTDADGVGDNADAFPEDATETLDTDSDGVGDNADAFPEDGTETVDTDEDGVGDNTDAFPEDATETVDTDLDGVGDNADAFPEDATETLDTDSDGVGDNTDFYPEDAERQELIDTDGDLVDDRDDAFPEDATESVDTDADGVGDNADVFPEDATETVDTDNDGVGDNADVFPEDVRFSSQEEYDDAFSASIDDLEGNYETFKAEQLAALNTEKEQLVEDHNAALALKDEQITKLEGEKDQLNSQIETLNSSALTAGETLADRNNTISELTTKRDELTDTINGLNASILQLNADHTAALDAKDLEIQGLEGTVQEQTGTISDLGGQVTELEGQVADLEGQVSNLETEKAGLITNHDAAIALKDAEILQLGKDKDALDKRIGELEASELQLGETVNARNLTIAGLQDDKKKLEDRIVEVQGEKQNLIDAHTLEIQGKDDEISQLNNTITEQKGTILEQQDVIDTTSQVLGKEANLVTEEDIQLVTDYLAGVELTEEKLNDITRYDVTGQDDLVTQDDLDLLTQAYTLGDYTGFDPDADFNPATGMYKTVEEKDAEIAAQNQAAIEAEQQYELALAAQKEESDKAQVDALAQQDEDIRTEIRTQAEEDERKKKEEDKQRETLSRLFGPGRTVDVKTPKDPAVIQYEYEGVYGGDSIFATPQQSGFYGKGSPYAATSTDNPYSKINPYGGSLGRNTPLSAAAQQNMAAGGKVKAKTDEILRILGEK